MVIMTVTLFPFTGEDFPALLEPVVEIYYRAFSDPPYNTDYGDRVAFEAVVQRHILRSGFCGFWACDPFGKPVGFAYGYTGSAGQWWYDTVTRGLNPALVMRWLVAYFEFAELAVLPAFQGQGIGARLHDTLLACTRHATASLTTAQDRTPALALYEKRGWVTIRENFIFPGDNVMRRIMAKDLLPRNPSLDTPG
jgi:ribosomal protein S18 acetylase RimI-like enzyme